MKCKWCGTLEAIGGSETCSRSHAASLSRARRVKTQQIFVVFGLSFKDAGELVASFPFAQIERGLNKLGYFWQNRNWVLTG